VVSQSERQADSIAAIALELPEQPTTRDILMALAKSYQAGRRDLLRQPSNELALALIEERA